MNEKWKYDGSIDKYPIKDGEVWEQNGNLLAVNNIFDGVPEWMKEADLVFVDPPWNLRNVNSFVTKAGRNDYLDDFRTFYKKVFELLAEIAPKTAYVEIGKEYLADFITEMRKLYKYVTCYNSTYYYKKENICYIIRGSSRAKQPKLDYMDEEEIIAWICENEPFECIGDFVMGRGLVGYHAHRNCKRFVGCELNPARLAVLINRLGGDWNVTPAERAEPLIKRLLGYRGKVLDPQEIIRKRMREHVEAGMKKVDAVEKLAAHFGVTRITVYRWMSGSCDFPAKYAMVDKLAVL